MKGILLLAAAVLSANAQPLLTIKVDPRIELMAVTQLLADYQLVSDFDTQYRRDAQAWFAPFKRHPAVVRFAQLAKRGYSHEAPPGTMVCLGLPPELALQAPAERCGASRAGGIKNLEAWLAQLRDFAAQSDFMTFFRNHAELYSAMEQSTRNNIASDYAEDLENYHGVRLGSYTIVIAPLLKGSFGARISRSNNSDDIFGILGAGSPRDGIATFGSAERLRSLVWHEFGHSFSNPEIDRFSDALARSRNLYQPIAEKMRLQAYPDWQITVSEHVDRAVEIRLTYRELGSEAGDRMLAYQRTRGFAYLTPLVERLKEYEEHRDRYPRFAAFLPRLISLFDELAADPPGPEFYQTLPVLSEALAPTRRRVFILPTAEADPAVQARIHDYVRRIQQRYAAGAEVLTDNQALTRDLSNASVLAYGTIAGNKWLARYKNTIPALPLLETAKEPDHLQLIAVFPNPQNPKIGAVAYLAATAGAIEGINAVTQGNTSWVLASDSAILSSGYYVRRDARWTLPQ